jgi:hypothetical protein
MLNTIKRLAKNFLCKSAKTSHPSKTPIGQQQADASYDGYNRATTNIDLSRIDTNIALRCHQEGDECFVSLDSVMDIMNTIHSNESHPEVKIRLAQIHNAFAKIKREWPYD